LKFKELVMMVFYWEKRALSSAGHDVLQARGGAVVYV
jgi:hypothetical protein